ncbi:MAG: hypothetical protein PHH60_01495, partial [Candidatus Margulisbacteria bacterium]|nr:hypothetical protein [Candidatus Margulisiibacteriota bacterium]
ISFPKGITAKEVKSYLRHVLYTSFARAGDEQDPRKTNYGGYLREVIYSFPGLDTESIANLLADLPNCSRFTGTRKVSIESSDYPGTGARYLEAGIITSISTENVYEQYSPEEQASLAKELLALLDTGKRESVLALLQAKNPALHKMITE